MRLSRWPWMGLFGGVIAWLFAHEIGIYFSDYNCKQGWILPSAHIVSFIFCIYCGSVSFRLRDQGLSAVVSSAAAGLFAIVISWQALASFIFSGCER